MFATTTSATGAPTSCTDVKIKRDKIDLANLGEEALVTLDQVYEDGSAQEASSELREISRNELVLLQKAARKTLLSGSKS